jgi:hypothetical protein
MTFVELCEEFQAKYGIDALGMSILNIKKHISTEDRERLNAVLRNEKGNNENGSSEI